MSGDIEVYSNLQIDGRPAQVMNQTGVSTDAIMQDPQVRQLASAMGEWVSNARSRGSFAPNMFRRDRYVTPSNPYDKMRMARDAVESDDIVSGVAEATEAIAFSGLKWEGQDADGADVFNQISADLNLDAVVRAMHRDMFRYEQTIVAKIWGNATYTVRGQTKKGNKRKKVYNVWVPKRLVTLDSMKCVPIGTGPLREDRLAWFAGQGEIDAWNETLRDAEKIDPLMTSFFSNVYSPDDAEKRQLAGWGVDPERLLEMNPESVFRHTSTRPDYEYFAALRLTSVFALLDLKQQLIASDRASLIGAANYILLIRKGNDAKPGTPEEIANLKEGYNFLAKLPVIISDHRLDIEIIAPKLDFVLKDSAYATLDKRILNRLVGNLDVQTGNSNGSGGSPLVGAFIAKAIGNRRHMLKRTLERELADAIVNHPKNEGIFEGAPSLVYTPREVSIATDQAYSAALLALRTQREISRETILEYLGLDEATEAQRMELESDLYDDIFKTQVPFAAPGAGGAPAPAEDPGNGDTPNGTPEAPATSGRRGGRPAGGGSAPQSPQGRAKPKTSGGGNTGTQT